ncbi:cell wall-binding repeat-containing protein [Schumannella luteola]
MLTRACAAGAAVLLGAGLLSAPAIAVAEESNDPVEMGEYSPSDYVAEAAELPVELVDALGRDLGISPEQYLAESDAAVQAVEVVASLEQAGVPVIGSRMEGTELVVNVDTEDAVSAVESAGALAEVGLPAPEWDSTQFEILPAGDLYDGQGWVWSDGTYIYQCSVGFTGFSSAGAKQLATAGHCTDDMSGNARVWTQTAPGQAGTTGEVIGAKVSGTPMFGSGYDVGRIAVGAGVTQKASALTWGGSRGAPLASAPKLVTGDVAAIEGATICKSGSRTGWSCGAIPTGGVDSVANICVQNCGGPNPVLVTVNSVVAKLCVLPGDSGGTALIGTKAVGITSWTTANTSTSGNVCIDSGAVYGGFFQLVSPGGDESVATAYPGTWELAATVSAPTITSISTSAGSDTAINGTVPDYGRNYKVDVYLDGSTTAFATATVNAGTGAWSVSTTSVPSGIHSFSAVARYGTWSKSAATTGYIKRGVTVDRIAGADRYATSALIASLFPTAPDRVYIANGTNYPDALSAAPVAAINGAPLLLTYPTALQTATANALTTIDPSEIVILGGTPSVSTTVQSQIAALLPDATITRIAGADRFETSRLVTQSGFSGGAAASYISNGLNFPDALSAGAAASSIPGPVVLVNGTASTADTATKNLLTSLGIGNAYITGSTDSVSAGIMSSIDSLPGVAVQRLSGPDRYQTSVAINSFAFATATEAYLALGTGFPDALSGGALAGATSAPLFVVPGTCVPAATLAALSDMGVTAVHLLGSSASLDGNVAALKSC